MNAVRRLQQIAGSLFSRYRDPQRQLIKRSGLFDEHYYRRQVPDCGKDALGHYLEEGVLAPGNPCAYFDTTYYCEQNPDVIAAGMHPFVHFLRSGWQEGRHPSAQFDLYRYHDAYLSSRSAPINALQHYHKQGRHLGYLALPVQDTRSTEIIESDTFDADFYLEKYPDVAALGINPLFHFVRHGAAEGRWPNAWFNPYYYLDNNPDIEQKVDNALMHFIRDGWRELRNPAADFDVWWYWSTYMDPTSEQINPLGHYLKVGRHQQLLSRPPVVSQCPGTGASLPKGKLIRRICLFAGYDVDGLVDDYVVNYLRELSRYADVYYLADCEMQAGQLERLAGYTKGAWAFRHGDYDIGSYARLAHDLVGWRHIEEYDELLLVNDSCYLLKPLDEVFAEMDARCCDWWGLQASKGIAATRHRANNQYQQPIPMDTVRQKLLPSFQAEYTYDFLIGSYFMVMRRPVIQGRELRRLLDNVVYQSDKRLIILKYEVGLTRALIAAGYQFETYIDHLYPFHPIFSDWYFRLLDKGFPLLKRYLLSHNHYQVQHLVDWPQRIKRKVPGADIATIEANLTRVVDQGQLQRTLNIGVQRMVEDRPQHEMLLSDSDFHAQDLLAPKHADWWAFPACAFTGAFSGNERAVFEQVKHDPSIRKIVFSRSQQLEVDGTNVEMVPLESPRGQYLLMRCGQIFIKHSPTRNLVYPVAYQLHNIINLWHGIPYKRIGFASLDMKQRMDAIAEEHAKCKAVIASSKVDAMAMTSAFYPLSYNNVWITGLPRNDFILRDQQSLPVDMQAELIQLQEQLAGRKLILYMPTFRNGQEGSHFEFSAAQLQWFHRWLLENNAVLGLREHMADTAKPYARQFKSLDVLDLSDKYYPNVEMLYRTSSALVTDYSSTFIDYMLTGKPAISFAYDITNYAALERGSFYDLQHVFPGPVCTTFEDFQCAIAALFDASYNVVDDLQEWKCKLFFDYIDDENSQRVVDHVKELSDLGDIGKTWKYGEIH